MELMPLVDIKINEEYQTLVPPLDEEEYNSLKSDIQKSGRIYVALKVNKDGYILDGHHRYKIATELGITNIPFDVLEFADELDEKAYVIESNINRRNLSNFQKVELWYELLKIENAKAAKRQVELAGTRKTTLASFDAKVSEHKGKASEKVAQKAGVSQATVERAAMIIKFGSEQLKEEVRKQKKSVNEGYNEVRAEANARKKEDKRKKLEEEAQTLPEIEGLHCGDFIEVANEKIADSSIDSIVTDPPYGTDAVEQYYRPLAQLAKRVLKDGGHLLTYAGQYTLPKVMDELRNAGLTYQWTIAVHHPGNNARAYRQEIFIDWKPIIWFVNGDKPNYVGSRFSDYIESKRDKSTHDWQQDIENAVYLIDKVTVKGQIVLDPFLGSGTTGIAAKRLDRQFIGIEKDSKTFARAKTRMYKNE